MEAEGNQIAPENSAVNFIPTFQINLQAQPEEPKTPKECRICLEDESEGRILTPCQCSGSLGYIHESCLISWLNRKHTPETGQLVQCELCKTEFKYSFKELYFLDCEYLQQNMKRQRLLCVMAWMIQIFLALCIILISAFLGLENDRGEIGEFIRTKIIQNESMRIIYFCFLIVVVIFFLTVVFFYIRDNAVRTEIQISDVKNREEKRKINEIKNVKKRDSLKQEQPRVIMVTPRS